MRLLQGRAKPSASAKASTSFASVIKPSLHLRPASVQNIAAAGRTVVESVHQQQSAARKIQAHASPYDKIPLGGDLPKDYDTDIPDWGKKRRAGVILHPTSLPGPYGIGELGEHCRKLVDWCVDAGLQCWQILPMVPPDPMFYSPYSGTDSNCGNPLVVSIDELIKEGLLDKADTPPAVPAADVDFETVAATKFPLLSKAADRLLNDSKFSALRKEMAAWRKAHAWVEDSAVFDVARNLPGLSDKPWWLWPEPLRFRDPEALKSFR